MRKTFLKTLVATAVVGSTVALGSIAAFAADGDAFSVKAEDIYSGATADESTKVKPTTSLTVNGATLAFENKDDYFGKFQDYQTVKNETGKTWTYEAKLGGGRTITITPVADGKITFYWYDNGDKNVTVGSNSAVNATNKVVTSGTADCTANTAFKITTDGSNVVLLEIDFEPTAKTGTQYDTSKFGTATTDNTAYIVDTSDVVSAVTGSDILAVAESSNESLRTDSDGNDTNQYTLENGTYSFANGNIVFTKTSGKPFWVDKNSLIWSGGKDRKISVTLAEGQAVLLKGYGASATGRGVTLDGVTYEAPTTKTDTVLTVSKAGTYVITSDANLYFDEIDIIGATAVTAPSVAITVDGNVIVGTISGDDDLEVSAISVAVAKGYDASATKIGAKSADITKVYNNQFQVTVSNADDFKAQASVTYKNNGSEATSYSAVVANK